jgi:hypothetical protein
MFAAAWVTVENHLQPSFIAFDPTTLSLAFFIVIASCFCLGLLFHSWFILASPVLRCSCAPLRAILWLLVQTESSACLFHLFGVLLFHFKQSLLPFAVLCYLFAMADGLQSKSA